MRQSAFFYDYPPSDGDVYGGGRRERIAQLTDVYGAVVHAGNFAEHAPALANVEVIFATWGMPAFTAAQLEQLPRLQAVFYAAGNVKGFAKPLLERDIVLVSAWAINAIATAQLVIAQILLTGRGYFRSVRQYRRARDPSAAKAFRRAGATAETVGLIGMGWIGQRVARELQSLGFHVLASDPFLTAEQALELGVEKVALDELFARSYIVSNHVPDLPSTRGMIGAALLSKLRDGATFINSGRGAQVVEADLVAVMQQRADLTALLDVTHPEPPLGDSELWTLPNVVLSPHIGGTIGGEVTRMADCVIEEYLRWHAGEPLKYRVTKQVFETMG